MPAFWRPKLSAPLWHSRHKRKDDRAAQQPRVSGPVRIMAGLAALDANRLVLVDEGAAFFRVALQAGLFIGKHLFHHTGTGGHAPGRCEGAVGIVAIRAGHESFVDAVLEGHGELAANVGVAAITEVGLALEPEEISEPAICGWNGNWCRLRRSACGWSGGCWRGSRFPHGSAGSCPEPVWAGVRRKRRW